MCAFVEFAVHGVDGHLAQEQIYAKRRQSVMRLNQLHEITPP
jgi:hypothetical protein